MNNIDKIKETKHILTMLDVSEINHDEVNARFWCLTKEYIFERQSISSIVFTYKGEVSARYYIGNERPKFTTSLDACKSLMLKGWYFNLSTGEDGHYVNFGTDDSEYISFVTSKPTLVIAWLQAILQSYIYTWEQENEECR